LLRRVSLITGTTLLLVLSITMSTMAQPIEIDFWCSGGREVENGINRIIDIYEQENPNVKVKLTMFSTWMDMSRRILLSIAGGDPPDCARMKPLTAGDLASRGALEPLSSYMERDGISPDEFVDVLIEKSSMYNGVMYVLPQSGSVPIMYYNVDLFEEVGLDPNRAPDTWEEIVEFGKKIADPRKYRWGYYPEATWNAFFMHLYQSGGQYLSDDLTTTKFNSPAGLEAVQWKIDLMHTYKITPDLYQWDAQDILNGNVGFWERALSGLSYYTTYAQDLNWRTSILAKNVRRTSMEMCEGTIIFSGARNKDAAWDWLKFLSMDPRAGRIFYEEYGHIPTTKAVLRGDYWQTDPTINPAVWHMLNDVEARPIMPRAQEMYDIIAAEIDLALYQQKSPEQALADAERQVQEILDSIVW
jgi:ABC-type glycerol-3-phosphate transport system substrate-binding protein